MGFGLATHNFLRGNRDEYAKALYSLDTVESIHFCNINTEGRRSRDYMGSYLPMTVTLLTRHPQMWKHNKGFRESQLSLVNSRLERGALREHIHNDRGGTTSQHTANTSANTDSVNYVVVFIKQEP